MGTTVDQRTICSHGWRTEWIDVYSDIGVLCRYCKKTMDWGEVDRRLNAVEYLSVEYATELAGALERLGFPIGAKYLRNYVKALELEDL